MSVPSHSRRGLARVSGARPDHVEVDPITRSLSSGAHSRHPLAHAGYHFVHFVLWWARSRLRSLSYGGQVALPTLPTTIANCFASRASVVSTGELRQTNPTGNSLKVCPSPRTKIFRLTCRANQ
jgi:hypothetical protein